MTPRGSKKPRAAHLTAPVKAVPPSAGAKRFEAAGDNTLAIRWSRFDLHGPWCIGSSDAAEIVGLFEQLQSIEKMTPHEVFDGGHPGKDYDVPALPTRAARDRLGELGYTDETRISRLRVSGPGRLYGFRRQHEFYALWWDPAHQIWPSAR
jgi:hypothetical protein